MKLTASPLVLAFAATLAFVQPSSAQPPRQDPASILGRGWTALGAQQPARALELAQQLLRTRPASHDALALAIAALTAGSQPLQALDAYDTWVAATRHDDPFLLQPIAAGVLRQLATSREPRIKLGALAALAEAGDADAGSQLQALIGDQGAPGGVDLDLAASGDQGAIARLEAQVTTGARDTSAAIDALARANTRGSAPALIAALSNPAPPTKIAAANALAEIGALDAIPALKAALGDPDPAVRHMVGVALARLGDESGGVTMQSLANSPIGELRLLAAKSAARDDPQGAWADSVQALLKDPDPLLRLGAVRLLLDTGRHSNAAAAALATALANDTPAVRTEAARLLRQLGQQQPAAQDLASLRRLLRDRLPDVQLEAARGLLAAVR